MYESILEGIHVWFSERICGEIYAGISRGIPEAVVGEISERIPTNVCDG